MKRSSYVLYCTCRSSFQLGFTMNILQYILGFLIQVVVPYSRRMCPLSIRVEKGSYLSTYSADEGWKEGTKERRREIWKVHLSDIMTTCEPLE